MDTNFISNLCKNFLVEHQAEQFLRVLKLGLEVTMHHLDQVLMSSHGNAVLLVLQLHGSNASVEVMTEIGMADMVADVTMVLAAVQLHGLATVAATTATTTITLVS